MHMPIPPRLATLLGTWALAATLTGQAAAQTVEDPSADGRASVTRPTQNYRPRYQQAPRWNGGTQYAQAGGMQYAQAGGMQYAQAGGMQYGQAGGMQYGQAGGAQYGQARVPWTGARRVTTAPGDTFVQPTTPAPAPVAVPRGAAPSALPADAALGPIPAQTVVEGPVPGVVGEPVAPGQVWNEPCAGSCCPGGGDVFCDSGACGLPCNDLYLQNLSAFVGAHGFKGPVDQGRNGNFGIHEGINWGAPIGGILGGDALQGVGYQIGASFWHSNFTGDQVLGPFRAADRNQIFLTGGFFRRALCGGLQYGAVFDMLHDQYKGSADFKQIRTELSLPIGCAGEFGFQGAFGDSKQTLNALVFEPLDQFNLFYRRNFCGGGDGRFWFGLTEHGDGLLGTELRIPLTASLGLENSVQLMIPREGAAATGVGQTREGWSLAMNLVWYPGRSAHCAQQSPYRPLFGVADNASFLLDQPRQ